TTEVALERLVRVVVVEDRAVGTGDCAQFAADAAVLHHHLGADRRDRDRLDRAGRHAPALGALEAGVGGVAGVRLERRHADDGLGRLEHPGLLVRASQLAAHAARAALRRDLEDLHGRRGPLERFPGMRKPGYSSIYWTGRKA